MRLTPKFIRNCLLIYLLTATAILSFHFAVHGRETLISELGWLTTNMALALACRADGRARHQPLASGTLFIILFTNWIAALIYLIGTRGLRGIVWALLWIIVAVVTVGLPEMIVYLIKNG